MIQKNIFQTHKTLKYIKSKQKLTDAVNSWKKFKNNFQYSFYNDTMCERFMKNNFDERINKAYSMLPLAVMKADLWRYCILYKYGGIYADTDAVCNVNPYIFINDSYITVSPEIGTPYFCQWTFSAPANSPVLKSIIDLSVDRILNTEIKGENIVHFLTGPECFTDGILSYFKSNNLPIFDHLNRYNKYKLDKICVFDKNNFHDKFIKHLFAGSDNDGWKKERCIKLKL